MPPRGSSSLPCSSLSCSSDVCLSSASSSSLSVSSVKEGLSAYSTIKSLIKSRSHLSALTNAYALWTSWEADSSVAKACTSDASASALVVGVCLSILVCSAELFSTCASGNSKLPKEEEEDDSNNNNAETNVDVFALIDEFAAKFPNILDACNKRVHECGQDAANKHKDSIFRYMYKAALAACAAYQAAQREDEGEDGALATILRMTVATCADSPCATSTPRVLLKLCAEANVNAAMELVQDAREKEYADSNTVQKATALLAKRMPPERAAAMALDALRNRADSSTSSCAHALKRAADATATLEGKAAWQHALDVLAASAKCSEACARHASTACRKLAGSSNDEEEWHRHLDAPVLAWIATCACATPGCEALARRMLDHLLRTLDDEEEQEEQEMRFVCARALVQRATLAGMSPSSYTDARRAAKLWEQLKEDDAATNAACVAALVAPAADANSATIHAIERLEMWTATQREAGGTSAGQVSILHNAMRIIDRCALRGWPHLRLRGARSIADAVIALLDRDRHGDSEKAHGELTRVLRALSTARGACIWMSVGGGDGGGVGCSRIDPPMIWHLGSERRSAIARVLRHDSGTDSDTSAAIVDDIDDAGWPAKLIKMDVDTMLEKTCSTADQPHGRMDALERVHVHSLHASHILAAQGDPAAAMRSAMDSHRLARALVAAAPSDDGSLLLQDRAPLEAVAALHLTGCLYERLGADGDAEFCLLEGLEVMRVVCGADEDGAPCAAATCLRRQLATVQARRCNIAKMRDVLAQLPEEERQSRASAVEIQRLIADLTDAVGEEDESLMCLRVAEELERNLLALDVSLATGDEDVHAVSRCVDLADVIAKLLGCAVEEEIKPPPKTSARRTKSSSKTRKNSKAVQSAASTAITPHLASLLSMFAARCVLAAFAATTDGNSSNVESIAERLQCWSRHLGSLPSGMHLEIAALHLAEHRSAVRLTSQCAASDEQEPAPGLAEMRVWLGCEPSTSKKRASSSATSVSRAYAALPSSLRDALEHGCAYPGVYAEACNSASAWLLAQDSSKDAGARCDLAIMCQHEALGASFYAQLRAQRNLSVDAAGGGTLVRRASDAVAEIFREESTGAVVSMSHMPCQCGLGRTRCQCPPCMLVTRCIDGSPAIALRLPTFGEVGDVQAAASSVRDVLRAANEGMKAPVDTKEQRLAWWKGRVALDAKLGQILRHVDEAWLGAWRGVLLGGGGGGGGASLARIADDLVDAARADAPAHASPALARAALSLLADAIAHDATERGEVVAALRSLSGASHVEAASLADELMALGGVDPVPSSTATTTCLVLGMPLSEVPLESLPRLCGKMSAYRISSVNASSLMGCSPREASVSSSYYLLNPDGDLMDTQARFAKLFEGWDGCMGAPPSASAATEALTSRDLFVYVGHGGGQKYFGGARAVRSLSSCASSVLMGCSSAKLVGGGGRYEAGGGPLAYVAGGAPAVVGCLWDITDGDVDRFALEFFDLIGLREESKKKKGGGKQDKKGGSDLGAALGPARAACKLRYLTGAAPVVYGFPISCTV